MAIPYAGEEAITELITKTKGALDTKLDAPTAAGTAGQVLTLNAQGEGEWQNPTAARTTLASITGMDADNVQDAVEELKEDLDDAESRLSESINIINSVLIGRTDWLSVQYTVRKGQGALYYPVGYEFTTHDADTNQDIKWRVVAHDHHAAADNSLVHTMTLELKNVYSNSNGSYKPLQFDAPEAFYYAESGLNAGTYHFNWDYSTGDVMSGTYQFTLTHAIPTGGQIVLGTNSSSTAITSCKVSTYASVGATSAIESNIAVTAGSGGTSLGTMSATSSTEANLNCCQRVMWGSNNNAQSAARQWLNSAATAGSVWTPTNKFDRAPSWNSDSNGFMHGLPSDFLAVVQPAVVPCRTNSLFEIASLDGTVYTINQVYNLVDKFFLLSRPEIFGDWDSADYKDGEQLEYYKGLTAAERIKREAAGSARSHWLRSPDAGYVYRERITTLAGELHYASLQYNHGIAPACIIA